MHGHVKERDEVRNVMRTSVFLLDSQIGVRKVIEVSMADVFCVSM